MFPLILELNRQHGPVTRKEVGVLLLPKLPERLSKQQKRAKVHNLLQELRRAGQVARERAEVLVSRLEKRLAQLQADTQITKNLQQLLAAGRESPPVAAG